MNGLNGTSVGAGCVCHPPCSIFRLRNFSLMWMRAQLPAPDFSPGIIFALPVNRPERVRLVQGIGKHIGE
jgi:hypothetical protein